MVIDFEPIVSISGQGYYLEDMYLVKKGSAEILTPGVPYTAEEIEAAMNQTH
jgi:Xaa-Pro aminopeptidase